MGIFEIVLSSENFPHEVPPLLVGPRMISNDGTEGAVGRLLLVN